MPLQKAVVFQKFLSTPSARRATPRASRPAREPTDFYPRPPRGGRLISLRVLRSVMVFLSTPSARRATRGRFRGKRFNVFLSTPSARRATRCFACCGYIIAYFYPRPPRGGRLLVAAVGFQCHIISIHALREEGDLISTALCLPRLISIHALREEGDQRAVIAGEIHHIFLSTPSARRATLGVFQSCASICISIHALREEGDGAMPGNAAKAGVFLSTPSARRATVFGA